MSRITEHTMSAMVVGRHGIRKYDVVLLLATNDNHLGFWTMKSEFTTGEDAFYGRTDAKWDDNLIKAFRYGYWAYNHDLRIAKVELKRNETLPNAV